MKTVNFLEAVNSGKRFRIVGSDSWWDKCTKYSSFSLTFDQVNSEFEVEEKEITITDVELKSAYRATCGSVYKYDLDFFNTLKEELGF